MSEEYELLMILAISLALTPVIMYFMIRRIHRGVSNKRMCYAQEHPGSPVWGYLVLFSVSLSFMTYHVFDTLPMGWGLYVMGTIMIAIDLVIGAWMVDFVWHNFRSRTEHEMEQYRRMIR